MTRQKEVAKLVQQFLTTIDDKKCAGCKYLQVMKPAGGILPANIDLWRDSYKAKCTLKNVIWLSHTQEEIQRTVDCMINDYKE